METTGLPYPLYEHWLDWSLLWFMTVLRLAGTFVLAPFFGSGMFPARAKIVIVVAFSAAMLPMAGKYALLPAQAGALELIQIAATEMMLGLALGFLSSIVFYAAQLAGELVGQQIGLSMANVLDPMTEQEVPLIGTLQMNIAMLVFVLARLDLTVIWIHAMGFRYVGIGQLSAPAFIGATTGAAMEQLTGMYRLGLQLALPVMTVMLLASVVEGYITRTMPQMNIMVLGIPLKLAIGFFALMLTIPGVAGVMMPETPEFDPAVPPAGPLGGMLLELSLWIESIAGDPPSLDGEGGFPSPMFAE